MSLSYQNYLDEKKKRGTVQPTGSSLSYETYQSQRQQANLTPSQRAKEELKNKEPEKPSFFNKVKTAASNFFGELSGKKKDERLQQLKPLEVPTTTPDTAQPLQVAQNNIIDDFINREKTVSAQLTPEAQVRADEFTLASIQKLKTINEKSKPILTEIAKRTSGTGIEATIRAASPEVTFKQAYEVIRKSQQEKDDTLPEQFLTGLKDTLPQTALGVALAFVPIIGKPLSTSYWVAVSAGSEIEEKGYATPTNVGIDVIGDRMLSGMMEKLFKVPAKSLIKIVKEAFVVEGGTEVAQDLLKFANDYRLAKSDEERGAVIDSAKNYFTSGQILITAAVGGVAGGGIAAITTGASRIIRITPDATQETVEISNLSNTEAGDALMKMSEKAKSEGREVVVDTSGLSGEIVVNTPEGNPIGIGLGEKVVEPKTTIISEEEPKKEPKVGEEEITASPEDLETTKKEAVVSEEVAGQEQIPVQDLNRKLSEKNTEAVLRDTLAGLREDQRVANDKLLRQFQLYNQKYNKEGITPETEITIYRAGSKEIQVGDQVTVSKLNATNYLEQRIGAKLFETTVKIKDLVFSEGKKDEFIYVPKVEDKPKIKEVDKKPKPIKTGGEGLKFEIENTDRSTFKSAPRIDKRYTAEVENKQYLITYDSVTKEYLPQIREKGIDGYFDKSKEITGNRTKTLEEAKSFLSQSTKLEPNLKTGGEIKSPSITSNRPDLINEKLNKGFGEIDDLHTIDTKTGKLISKSQPIKTGVKKKTKVLTVKQAERELEKARKLNKIMELKEVSKKKVKSKPLSMKYKKELQTMVASIVNSSKPQQEVVTDIDNFMHDLNQKADDSTYNNQLKVVRAEMKRQMYKITDIDTGNWKRDFAFFQVARNNPEVEQIVNKLEEHVLEISDQISPNAPAGPGYASSGSEVIDNFEKRDVPRQGTREFKMRERVVELVRKYAETIGERYTPRGALGVYYTDTKNIRVNAINNLSVATHEITHFLDFQYHISDKLMEIKGFSSNGRPIYETATSGLRKEITNLYMQYYPGGKKTHSLRKRTLEGFATLLQKYSEAPNRITSEYPKLVQQFLKPGGKYYQPVMGDILKDLNEIIVEYQGLSSLDKIGSKVANEKANVDKKSFLSFWDQVRTQIADLVYPIEVIGIKTGKQGTIDDPSLWVRAYNAVSGIINNNIATNRGYYRLKDGDIKKTSKENWKTLVDLTVKRKNSHDFGYYLVARREHFAYLELDTAKERLDQLTEQLKEMKEKGENPYDVVNDDGQTFVDEFLQAKDVYVKLNSILKNDGFGRAEIDAAYSENKERFTQEEKLYDMLVREDLEMMREVGLVNEKQYEKLSNQEGYASFKREFYDEIVGDFDGTAGQISVGKTKVSSLIGRKGSERTIINPLYNGMASHSEVMRKVLKQVVYNKLGNIGVSAALPTVFQKLQLKVSKDKTTGAILYPQERDPNIIMARDSKGKRVPILVDKQVKSILDDVLTYKNIEVFEKIYLGLSRMFTAGTTGLYPQFAATNFVVDQITAQVNSNNKYKAFYSSLSKLKLVVTKKGGKDAEYLQEYLVMGGERQTFTGWQKLSPDALFKRINGEKKGIEKAIELLDKGVDIAATPSKYSELVSRAAEYISSRKAGKPAIVALEDAGRVTAPFHHIGKWGGSGGKTFIRGLPFFNATLQVLDQSIRTYNTEAGRKRTLGMITIITAAYLASMLAMMDADDEQKEQYRDLEAEDLTNFLHLPMPGGKKLFRIKMSQTFSAFGAVLNMIIADTLMGTDYKPKEYLAAATAILPDQFNPLEPTKAFLAWLPQVFKPGIETAFGVKSYPKVRSLEGMALERLPAEFRFNENTSKFAKWLGEKLKLSPIKIDHLLTGYFGRVSGFLTGKPSATDLTSSVIRDYFFTYGRRVAATYELGTEVEQDYNAYQKGMKEVEDSDELYRTYMLTSDFEEIMRDYRKIDIEENPEQALEMRNEALKIMNMIETGENPKGFHSWKSDAEKRRRKNLRDLEKTQSSLPVEEKKPFSFKLVKEAYAAEGIEGSYNKLTWSKDIRTGWQKFLGNVSKAIPGDQKFENPIEGIAVERLDNDQKREYYNAMQAIRAENPDWYYKNIGNKVEKRILGFDLGKEEEVRKTLEKKVEPVKEEVKPTGTAREGVGEAVDDDVTYKGLIQRKPDESTDKIIKENTKDKVIKPEVVAAMLWQESGYKLDARNDGGENGVDRGIAQINSKSHPEVSDEQADDPEFAINWLVEELKRNLKKFDGDINRAIAAHNVGPGGANIKGPTPSGLGPKGQSYIDKVSKNLSPELRKELGIKTRYD